MMTGLDQSVSARYESRLVTVTRSPGNLVVVHESPLRAVADQVDLTQARSSRRLVVAGPLWWLDGPQAIVWRRFVAGSDDHVDVGCERHIGEGRWGAETDLRRLQAVVPDESGTTTWKLFHVFEDGSATAVRVDEFLACELPIEAGEIRGQCSVEAEDEVLAVRLRVPG